VAILVEHAVSLPYGCLVRSELCLSLRGSKEISMQTRFVTLFLLLAVPVACNDDNSTSTVFGDVPERVDEEVREEYPRTRTDDIAVDYRNIKTDVPSATDDDAIQWMLEVLEWNAHTDEWNDCLEQHDGQDIGCTEPDESTISEDNPLGW
jgi:hypothetical protein